MSQSKEEKVLSASEMIANLQRMIELHGDLPMVVSDYVEGNSYLASNVVFHEVPNGYYPGQSYFTLA